MYATRSSSGMAVRDTITGCDIHVSQADEVKTSATNESYNLTIRAPRIEISAVTAYGAMYALESLSQLVDDDLVVDEIEVLDHPRFAFRATMIDTARHYHPVDVIKHHLDAMSYAKMNVLHWHITDLQSFPLVSTSFPFMSEEGAYSPRHVYTHDDIRDLIDYSG
eukprot:TRINITY_DN23058_c0_g2_i4.p1 TRINITY_DN23058_c0_g2~~TRINITY_DN23058_c0_g2_i4.p1  ORF type:complete len:165 (-),score=24.98 TRINITY_DN23058_c0_g2_i4:133-627(-)